MQAVVLGTQLIHCDAVMDDNASVLSWSSTDTLVDDVQIHGDDTSDLDDILQFNNTMVIEDLGQHSLCNMSMSKVTLSSSNSSGEVSLMNVDEDILVDVSMFSLSGNDDPSLGDHDISMEILVSTSEPSTLSGSSRMDTIEPTSISTLLDAEVCVSTFLVSFILIKDASNLGRVLFPGTGLPPWCISDCETNPVPHPNCSVYS